MCCLLRHLERFKQSETFVYYKTIRTPLFPFWICDSETRWEKVSIFWTFLVFGRKNHPFLVGSISISIAQAVPTSRGKSHHRSTTDDARHAKSTEPWHLKWRPGANGKWHICLGCMLWISVSNMWISKLTLIKCAYRRFGRWLLRSSRLTMYKGASCKFQSLL